jgi:hypothetical protein
MRTLLLSLSVLVLGFTSGCKSTGNAGADPQVVIETIAKTNPGVTRLTVHCMQAAGGAVACASTAADKKGKPSDAEDLKAMQTGETVVLEESGALDVTVPIMQKDGKFGGACGVTMSTQGMTREQVVAKAKEIAQAVDKGLGGCCSCCADGTCCAK